MSKTAEARGKGLTVDELRRMLEKVPGHLPVKVYAEDDPSWENVMAVRVRTDELDDLYGEFVSIDHGHTWAEPGDE